MGKRPRGPLPNWTPTTERQKAILADATDRYEQHAIEDTLPRSPRGTFYDLRPHGFGRGVTYLKPVKGHKLGPMEASPDTVQEVLVLARRAGLIDERWVADTRAPEPLLPEAWEDADDLAQVLAEQVSDRVSLNRQEGQSHYVEVLCEAEDLAPRLYRIAGPYGVPVYPGAGFDGLKGKRAFAERAAEREVPTVVLRIVDLDLHGGYIYDSSAEDAEAWVPFYDDMRPDGWLRFWRVAVTREQAAQHGLIDAEGKAEADGLPVPVLDAILRDALDSLLDPTRREEVLAREVEERERLPEAVRRALG